MSNTYITTAIIWLQLQKKGQLLKFSEEDGKCETYQIDNELCRAYRLERDQTLQQTKVERADIVVVEASEGQDTSFPVFKKIKLRHATTAIDSW